MKPERKKKTFSGTGGLRASLRKRFKRGTKHAPTNHNLVQVCELLKPDPRKKNTPLKSGDFPSSMLPKTPLGTPSCKKPKLGYARTPVAPLDLTPPAAQGKTEMIVIDTSIQEEFNLSAISSSSSLTIESVGSEQSASSSFASSDCEESSERSLPSDQSLRSQLSMNDDVEDSVASIDGSRTSSEGSNESATCNFSDEYRLISLPSCSSYLLLLPHGNTRLPVRGLADLKSLFGTVTILGYNISPEREDPVPVFCPTNVSFLSLETRQTERRELSASERKLLLKKLSSYQKVSMNEELLVDMRSDSVLLHVSILNHGPSKFLTSFHGYNHLYTGGSAKKTLPKEEISLCHKVGFFMSPNGAQEQNIIQPLPAYNIAAQSILHAVQQGSGSPRVLFVGPKNSGKSTALRYVTNRLQNVSAKMCYLECDPGQTEFTVPAVLSLHVITKPLLGPPCTHLQKPERACFLGDVSPASSAETYMKMIGSLYQHYMDNFPELPLFINTMGWVEGLGLRLLREIVCLIHPTHMVQLVPKAEDPIALVPGDDDMELSHFNISSPVGGPVLAPEHILTIEANSQSDSYQASSHRDLNILASLSRLVAPREGHQEVLSLTPCLVPWSQVILHVCHQKVPISQVLYAANASIVALCSTTSQQITKCGVEECEEGLRTFSATPISEFVGIGIIRGIDPVKRLFYILPAVPTKLLPRVNTLLIGSLPIPECIFKQQCQSQEVPYMSESFDSQICGSLPVKPKTYLKRGPGGRSAKT